MTNTVLSPASGTLREQLNRFYEAYGDAVRPVGCLEEFACQRLAYARFNFERATNLSLELPDSGKYEKLALRWEASYNRALRELRHSQTQRALANPAADAPLADQAKLSKIAKRTQAPSDDPEPQTNQQSAKRTPPTPA